MTPDEINTVQTYLRKTLNPGILLEKRDKTTDSVEVYLGEEFIALLFRIDEEGETSYQFQMTILKEDLAL